MTEPHVLVCAGLDPSGGAGILADARVAALLGTRAVGVVTTQTVQNTTGVRSIHPLDADLIREQLEALLSDVEVHAVKLGMLGSPSIAAALGEALHLTGAPVVWDPVLRPSQVAPSYDEASGDSPEPVLRALAPHLRLVTPNARELAWFVGRELATRADALAAAAELARTQRCAVLVKAGHYAHAADAIDVLVDGDQQHELATPWLAGGEDVHGTGCALSTAIAAYLARGASLVEACREAKSFVHDRIAKAVRPGRGAAAVV